MGDRDDGRDDRRRDRDKDRKRSRSRDKDRCIIAGLDCQAAGCQLFALCLNSAEAKPLERVCNTTFFLIVGKRKRRNISRSRGGILGRKTVPRRRPLGAVRGRQVWALACIRCALLAVQTVVNSKLHAHWLLGHRVHRCQDHITFGN